MHQGTSIWQTSLWLHIICVICKDFRRYRFQNRRSLSQTFQAMVAPNCAIIRRRNMPMVVQEVNGKLACLTDLIVFAATSTNNAEALRLSQVSNVCKYIKIKKPINLKLKPLKMHFGQRLTISCSFSTLKATSPCTPSCRAWQERLHR
jgi:hypothetical protein